MKWKKWLENWDMTSLSISAGFLDMEWEPREPDRDAAWELYIELLTRIATQSLSSNHGEEVAALKSVHSLFGTTRSIIKTHGRDCMEFTKIAIVVLNQIVRPFTAKWHRINEDGGLEDSTTAMEFRTELAILQTKLQNYTGMLGDMAGVESLTNLERTD